MRKVEKFEAHLDDYKSITVYLSERFYNGRSDAFYIRDQKGKLTKCDILNFDQCFGGYFCYTLSLTIDLNIGEAYELLEEHGLSTPLQYSLITKTDKFDETFFYEGSDLGCHPKGDSTDFALWAPTATRVVLEVFRKDAPNAFECERTDKGVYRVHVDANLHGIGYHYHILVNGKWNVSSDPIARSSIANNGHSVCIDYDQVNVEKSNNKLPEMNSPLDAIIYELSVRDFTMQKASNVKHRGKFLGLCEKGTRTNNGVSTGLDHIKELGITHVQIMPMFDFATVDEINVSTFYNWGYDPLQYNVPDGSFCTKPHEPVERVREAKEMIQSFHKEGIRVIMDVVYNHVYDMDSSPFELVVPYYYFRRSHNGALSNGSFCGNDFDSNRLMARKFILDSIDCWMKQYDVDGFRFDLMGVLDIETMNQVVKQAKKLKPEALIYGEGWNMPTALPEELKANKLNQYLMPEVGQFNDFFRDIVKGKTNAEEVNVKGYCTGDTNMLEAMKACMVGNSLDKSDNRHFLTNTQSINYVECHDNHTVWDKMKESNREDSREVRIKRQKLMIGTTLLSIGTPFLHSGQEFARTKNGVHNSYRSPDNINQIDWERKERFLEIVDYTKDLIKLRKSLPIFHNDDQKLVEAHVDFRNFDGMLITHYACPKLQPYQEIWIYINPSNQIYSETFDEKVMIIADEFGLVDGELINHVDINPYTLTVFAR